MAVGSLGDSDVVGIRGGGRGGDWFDGSGRLGFWIITLVFLLDATSSQRSFVLELLLLYTLLLCSIYTLA